MIESLLKYTDYKLRSLQKWKSGINDFDELILLGLESGRLILRYLI